MSQNDKAKGRLLVVSGYSGVGKGTVIKALMEQHPEYVFSVSATTRAARPGEVDGREYFFLTQETFKEWLAEGRFLEHTTYLDRSYGTPRDYVESRQNEGCHVILDIEVEGALNVKKACPEAILIYIIPPGAGELIGRLTGRGTETEEQVIGRLNKAIEETAVIPSYDHVVVNREVQETADEINALVTNDVPEIVSRDMPALADALAPAIDHAVSRVVRKRVAQWKDGAFDTLEDMSNVIRHDCDGDNLSELLNESEGYNKAISQWLEDVVGRDIALRLKDVCERYGMQDIRLEQLNMLTTWSSRWIISKRLNDNMLYTRQNVQRILQSCAIRLCRKTNTQLMNAVNFCRMRWSSSRRTSKRKNR